MAAGQVQPEGLAVADKQTAAVGDVVVTRENNRLLTTGKRWVKNGDRWAVTATHHDGSMRVRRVNGTGEVVLPADYVGCHVELASATTAHRAQGRTVDTAHAMVSPTGTREVLYVSATRGRDANHLYVNTSYDPDPATSHDGMTPPQTPKEVLAWVLAREGADLPAHETIRRIHHQAEDFATVANEYLTLAREAQQQRSDDLLDRCGLSAADLEAVRSDEAYGPLLAALRDAEARGLDVDSVFPRLAASRTLDDAADPAAVLHGRVDRWADAAGGQRQAASNLVAGFIPRVPRKSPTRTWPEPSTSADTLERRSLLLAEDAIEHRRVWVRRLGTPPSDPRTGEPWMRAVATVAAYRDRWEIRDDRRPLGPEAAVKTIEGLGHRKRAQAAIETALHLAEPASPPRQDAAVPVYGTQAERGIEL